MPIETNIKHWDNSLPGAAELRIKCHLLLEQWSVIKRSEGNYNTLKKLLGIKDMNAWPGTTEDEMRMMRGLCGPYGQTYCKMLLIKREQDEY